MKKTRDIITIGFALFAMFFGAGNLLLPPYIGIQIGDEVWVTIFAFGLTGILLPFLGILSVVNSGETFRDLGQRINPYISPILGSAIMLCIGPLIAIPRTAATTFEVGILPNFQGSHPFWTSVIFFAVTWALTIAPSKVIDIIGNFLTPVLLLLLLCLIGVGIFAPTASYAAPNLSMSESFSLGFIEGYQTLDVLASVIFAGIIVTAAKVKGYKHVKAKNQVVIAAGILSASCLFIIYGGLIYLGATSGITEATIKRSELLIHISHSILGPYGMIAIALSIALACLTTAIALVAAVGTFFTQLTKGKLSYKLLVTICCVFSCILSITGVDNIISFAYPILIFVYPIVITLVLYTVFFGAIVETKAPYVATLISSTIIATFSLFKHLNLLDAQLIDLLNYIPFFQYELGWVVPSISVFIICCIIYGVKNKTDQLKQNQVQ